MARRHDLAFASGVAILALSSTGWAQHVVYAPSGEQPVLQTAVEALAGSGVIVVPPGTWNHVGSLNVLNDGVTIIGAGESHTTLRREPPPPGADTATRELYTTAFIRSKGRSGVRVAHLTIHSWAATGGTEDLDVGIRLMNMAGFRVDHCRIRFTGDSGVKTSGDSFGVVDHCTFEDIYEDSIGNYGYGVSVYGTGEHTGEPYGTERATFIEDSEFVGCRHAVASNRGARYVFRHNDVRENTVSHAVDTHGAEYPPSPRPACDPCYNPDPDNPGTEWAIVHDNIIEDPVYDGYAVTLRGGKGLVYRNVIRGYGTAIRLSQHTPEPTGPVHLWDNDVEASAELVVGAGTCCGMTPEWEQEEPAGYAGYPYPHPSVIRLEADAGPDQRVMLADGAITAGVFVDGSGTSVHKETVKAVRWYTSPTPGSDCVRDVIDLSLGQHVLLYEVLTESGRVSYDTALIDVLDHGPLASSPSWEDLWFAPFLGTGTVSFVVTPGGANTDAYVALAGRHAVSGHDDHAMHVRLNNEGVFDARDGDTYAADATIPYESGQDYDVEMRFDVADQQYDVLVDGEILAAGYSFRRAEERIGQLTAWHGEGTSGITVRGIAWDGEQDGPDPACQDLVDAGMDAPVPEPDAASDASTDASTDAAVPDASEDAGAGGAGGASAGPAADEGCACHAVRTRSVPSAWLLAGLLVVAAGGRRRRAARSPGRTTEPKAKCIGRRPRGARSP